MSFTTFLFRIVLAIPMLVVTVDVAKTVFPYTCSLGGHYHLVEYNKVSTSRVSGLRWSSGRPVTSSSGGKMECSYGAEGILAWIEIGYNTFVRLLALPMLLLPAIFQFLIPIKTLDIILRIVGSIMALYHFLSVTYRFLKTGEFSIWD